MWSRCGSECDAAALLDDDNDDHDVEEHEEDAGRLVSDEGEAAAEEWAAVKEAAPTRQEVTSQVNAASSQGQKRLCGFTFTRRSHS